MKTKQTFFLVALAAFNIAAAQNENVTVYLLNPITSISDSGVSTFKPATECKVKSHNGDSFILTVGETELSAKQSDITLNKAQADNAAVEFKAAYIQACDELAALKLEFAAAPKN